jgi:hypothetical protein
MVQKGQAVPVIFCGRHFSAAEIELVREVVADFGRLSLNRDRTHNLRTAGMEAPERSL